MLTRYRVVFEFRGIKYDDILPFHWGVGAVKEGFWISRTLKVNPLASKSVYWIPPHKVEYVEKLPEEDDRDGKEED